MNDVYLLTGGNIGDRLQKLQLAAEMIEASAGSIIKQSSIYETAAWGITDQNAFLNQVLLINTSLQPEDLLQKLLSIEFEMGRKRLFKMGPRSIDIDILFYGSEIINATNLTVPHPRIADRRFVLTPLVEIAPNLTHPIFQKTMTELLKECTDTLEVNLYKS